MIVIFRILKGLSLLSIMIALASCSNPAYIKKAAKIYPHKNPQEKMSEGTYLTKKTKPQKVIERSSEKIALKETSDSWKKADKGAKYKVGDP